MKLLCCLIFIFNQALIFGQPSETGIIKYKQTTYFEFENMPADMPKSQESFMKLLYTGGESKYEKDADVVVEENVFENSSRMMRRMRERSNKIYYKNLDENIALEQINLFGKDFIISDSISTFKWKISAGEQKNILGYNCMKALYKDSTSNLIVFFAPQISSSFGPDKYGKLPGMILEVQSAQMHIIATEINLNSLATVITKPNQGDVITRKEFDKMREEKMKEQREMWGRREGNVRLIRQ